MRLDESVCNRPLIETKKRVLLTYVLLSPLIAQTHAINVLFECVFEMLQ